MPSMEIHSIHGWRISMSGMQHVRLTGELKALPAAIRLGGYKGPTLFRAVLTTPTADNLPSTTRMTPKVLICAKLSLASPSSNPITVPWRVVGPSGSLGGPRLLF